MAGGLPIGPGVGFKPQHFTALLYDPGPVSWLEIHAENYMGAGGRPLAQLRHLAERFPISVHGLGLSIGSEGALNRDHLDRVKNLCDAVEAASFSEHLAWSTHDGAWLADLLPLPYTAATLSRVVDHIDEVQDHLGRRMLLENPSSYLAFVGAEMDEADFLRDVARRTGCGLLLDVNNVQVSAVNLGFDAADFLARFPLELVEEMHLGGHQTEVDDTGAAFLIDSHGAEVAAPVWNLFAAVVRQGGARPVLIEWDNAIPDWAVLRDQAGRAGMIMSGVG